MFIRKKFFENGEKNSYLQAWKLFERSNNGVNPTDFYGEISEKFQKYVDPFKYDRKTYGTPTEYTEYRPRVMFRHVHMLSNPADTAALVYCPQAEFGDFYKMLFEESTHHVTDHRPANTKPKSKAKKMPVNLRHELSYSPYSHVDENATYILKRGARVYYNYCIIFLGRDEPTDLDVTL